MTIQNCNNVTRYGMGKSKGRLVRSWFNKPFAEFTLRNEGLKG